MLRFTSLLAAMLVSACGDDSTPQAPTRIPSAAPSGTVQYSFAAGDTGSLVAASISVGGQARGTGSSVSVTAPQGSEIRAVAPGFLTRDAVVTTFGPQQVFLFPERPGLDRLFYLQLLYADDDRERSLYRVMVPAVFLRIDSSIDSAMVRRVVQNAADRVTAANRWTGFQVSANPPVGSVVFDIVVNGSIPGAGGTSFRREGRGVITGGTIDIQRLDIFSGPYAITVLAHEMGHAFGLGHLWDSSGLMSGDVRAYQFTDFTLAEATAMWLVQYRSAGNRFPDDARGIGGALRAGGTFEVGCRLPPPP